MKRKMLISIISVIVALAIGAVAVYAVQCAKYSYYYAGTLYEKSTAYLGANADSTYSYLNMVTASVRADHNGGEAMTAVDLKIFIKDQNGRKLGMVTGDDVAMGGYINVTVPATTLDGKNVTSATAYYTVTGYNSRAGAEVVDFSPAEITITVDECE